MIKSVVGKTLAGLILTLLTCFAALLYGNTVTVKQAAESRFETNALITSEFVASQINTGTRLKRGTMIEPQISSVLSADGLDVTAIRVTHVEGVLVSEKLSDSADPSILEAFPEPSFEQTTRIGKHDDHILVTVPVMLGAGDARQLVGEATLSWSTQSLGAELQSFVQVMSHWFFVALVISALATYLVLSRVLSRPLRASVHALTELSQGNLDVDVPSSRSTELMAISNALSSFKDGLNERAILERRQAEQRKAEHLAVEANNRLSESLANVADLAIRGDFSARLNMDGLSSEGEDIARQINALLEQIGSFMDTTTQVLRNLAQKDLSIQMDGRYEGAFAEVQKDANVTIETLHAVTSELLDRCTNAQQTTETVTANIRELAERVESQAESLRETSATANIISSGVNSNATRLKDAERKVRAARENVMNGRERIDATTTAMDNIEASAEKITSIISVIDSISFQTNLLALNAAVEAARAGEAGKGFAVVAAEVRSLAQRSTDAASDITALINESSNSVSSGVSLVAQTAESLDKIEVSIEELANDISCVATEGASQSQAVTEINQSIGALDDNTQANAQAAENMVSDIATLSSEMDKLQSTFSEFVLTRKRDEKLSAA